MIDVNKRFLIVGLGLIGGCYAKKLTSLGYKVSAIDIDNKAIDFAICNGIINNDNLSEKELISSADYIILGLYPTTAINWIKENKSLIKDDVLISDVSGVKGNYVNVIQEELKDSTIEFISMHPMAGREVSGVYNSDPSIFEMANMIIIKTDNNTQRGYDFANELANLLDFKNIEQLTVDQHDEMIAFLSQLPHAIAVSLMNCHDNEGLHRFTGDSFRDLTRIAKINENLWSELFISNKQALIKNIDSFIETLATLKEEIQNEDIASLKKEFISSTKKRKSFEK